MTLNDIRKDLREIRYYYSMKDVFSKGAEVTHPKVLTDKVNKYNRAIALASPRLYALYVELYVENNTQLSLGLKWGCSEKTIRYHNKNLCVYFKNYFDKHKS